MGEGAAPGNGDRVTLAKLAEKIDSLTYEVRESNKRNCDDLDDHEQRLRSLETEQTRTRTILGGWNLLVTGLAAWLAGSR